MFFVSAASATTTVWVTTATRMTAAIRMWMTVMFAAAMFATALALFVFRAGMIDMRVVAVMVPAAPAFTSAKAAASEAL